MSEELRQMSNGDLDTHVNKWVAETYAKAGRSNPYEFIRRTYDTGLEYERRIVAAECGTQRVLNELVDWLNFSANAAFYNNDACDPKAGRILDNIIAHIKTIDVTTPIQDHDAERPHSKEQG